MQLSSLKIVKFSVRRGWFWPTTVSCCSTRNQNDPLPFCGWPGCIGMMGGSVTSTTLTQVLCSLLFPPPERGCRQRQRTQTLDSRTERLNSETDSEIHSTPTVVHEAKRLQTSKLWRSFWTGVISPLGYPSDVPFRIRTYDSAAYKPLVSFVIRTTCLGGSWDRWILLLHGGIWAHIL